MGVNEDIEAKEAIEAKRFNLSITSYGIHALYSKKLKEIFKNEFDTSSFYIYEYLLDSPIVKGNDKKASKISTFAPYLRRILSEMDFVPKYDNNIKSSNHVKFSPQSFKNIKQFWNAGGKIGASDSLNHTMISKQVFNKWQEFDNEKSDNKSLKQTFLDKRNDGLVIGNWQCQIKYLKDKYLSELQSFSSKNRNCFLKEYFAVVYPWTLLPQTRLLNIGAISLSTNDLYYGVILVFYPNLSGMNKTRGIFSKSRKINHDNGDSLFLLKLKSIIVNRYLPVLLLHENSWKEKEISEIFDNNEWEREPVKMKKKLLEMLIKDKCVFLNDQLNKSNNSLELSLNDLWEARKKLINESNDNIKTKLTKLKESLIFSKYSIASLGMINELEKIMVKRMKKESDDYLPSVLVIGSPGSGKDRMAQIVSLFFPEYRFGKRYTLNMASIKPSSLSVPLLSGANVDMQKGISMKIDGIFKKIWDDYTENEPEDNEIGFSPVVILDELNSLDIDAQGALLRVLENGKLQPLGSIGEQEVRFLVIGIVNEPEKVLTLHEPLQRFLKDDTIFGGLLGKVFYEYFRGMRRLREDIYFRMIRDAKIEIPNLADRRTDIPMLFKVFLENELKYMPNKARLWIDYQALDELMSESLPWNGNFRELQSLTKRIVQKAKEDISNKGILLGETENQYFRVSCKHVSESLKEMNSI